MKTTQGAPHNYIMSTTQVPLWSPQVSCFLILSFYHFDVWYINGDIFLNIYDYNTNFIWFIFDWLLELLTWTSLCVAPTNSTGSICFFTVWRNMTTTATTDKYEQKQRQNIIPTRDGSWVTWLQHPVFISNDLNVFKSPTCHHPKLHL